MLTTNNLNIKLLTSKSAQSKYIYIAKPRLRYSLTLAGARHTSGSGRRSTRGLLLLHPMDHLVDLFELFLGVGGIPFAGRLAGRTGAGAAATFAAATATARGSGGMHPVTGV